MGDGTSLAHVLNPTDITLRHSLSGDANFSNSVTLADFTIWSSNYGSTGIDSTQADFTGDFAVTLADFTVWAANYGATLGSASATSVDNPEPSTLTLLALGTLGLLGYGWRWKRAA